MPPYSRSARQITNAQRLPASGAREVRYNLREEIGVKMMVLTLCDLELLKQLRAAGGLGRNVRELNIRAILDRLVKGGSVGLPIDRYSVQLGSHSVAKMP